MAGRCNDCAPARAENANLHAQNRRLAQQISDLEDRLSDPLGRQAFDR